MMSIEVNFWGTRGSYSQCGEEFAEFGGLTSCVSFHHKGNVYIIDAGSGIGKLSSQLDLLDINEEYRKTHIFLSHLHMDHICGFPSFLPIWDPKFKAKIYSAQEVSSEFGGVEAALQAYFSPPYFPVSWGDFPAQRDYCEFKAGETLFPEGGCKVQTLLLNHPGGACGYRFSIGGKSIVYLSDTNHADDVSGDFFEKLVGFSKGADLVIYDATYNCSQYQKFSHYGHSTWEKGCELALKAGCVSLALFHHDYEKTDHDLRAEESEAKRLFPGAFVARCEQIFVI